jgi:aspartokinase
MEKIIDSVNYNTRIAKVTLHNIVDRRGTAGEIFSALGQQGLNVELISTNSIGHGRADISFAVLETYLDEVCKTLETIKDKFGTKKIIIDRDCAMITIYGRMLSATAGIAGKIFSELSDRKINIEMISASLSAVSIVVKKERVSEAVEAIRTLVTDF